MITDDYRSRCLAVQEYACAFLDQNALEGALPPTLGTAPNVMTTAEAFAAFKETGNTGRRFREEEAVRFIVNCQDSDGGWTDKEQLDSWDITTTAWAVYALRYVSDSIASEARTRGLKWLSSAVLSDGGLPTNKKQAAGNSYASAYTLRAIAAHQPSVGRRILEFLANTQNADGGWGLWPSDPSESTLTAYVLHGLLDSTLPESDELSRRGLSFLSRSRNLSGLWGSWLEEGPSVEGTAFCMYIFRRYGVEIASADLSALDYLVARISATDVLNIAGVSQVWIAPSLLLMAGAYLERLN